MKASELMQGDIVLYEYKGERFTAVVREIYKESVLVEEIALVYEPIEIPMQDIYPIPLTTEILEKNFRGYKRGSGSLTYFVYELNEEYFIRASARSVDFCTHYDDSEHAAHDDIYLVELRYVHTLQHVLPLYEIDKEITI